MVWLVMLNKVGYFILFYLIKIKFKKELSEFISFPKKLFVFTLVYIELCSLISGRVIMKHNRLGHE
jgi:hypothetical protein